MNIHITYGAILHCVHLEVTAKPFKWLRQQRKQKLKQNEVVVIKGKKLCFLLFGLFFKQTPVLLLPLPHVPTKESGKLFKESREKQDQWTEQLGEKLCKESVVTSSWHKWVRDGHDNAYYQTVNRVHYHKFSSNSSVTEGRRRKNSRLFDHFAGENDHWSELSQKLYFF